MNLVFIVYYYINGHYDDFTPVGVVVRAFNL